ncbi:hypothetical protein BGZ61DRAFT_454381 [Ilyonectria robusta]|uniref:uncharacterized protein n=1 Tax=Ilyonectria robusta TaxID=1079257 RepID=UPI001E8EE67B|nr:uncharacterized protein BGZ61DRAFT_454381 [Ilyonectria robusta]KAH8686369.1 hypothetical protein BGZ61DRAFT_454381 [Ilyonectria robusta]
MDPLSVVASIFAVVQIADRVISLCKYYLELSRDAPTDLRAILIETSALRTILDNIQFLASSGHGPTTLNTLTRDDGPIEGCRKTLNQLDGLFSSDYLHQTSGNRSKRRKVKATLTTLAWPFKENTARKLLVEVVQHKTTLNLALTVDMWCEIKRAIGTSRTMVSDTNIGCSHDIKIIKSQASEIQATLTEFQRHEVYKWLGDINTSPIHHRACSQYESGTGDWVLRSDDWKSWISGQKRSLWIHGIPGAGKTILTSHLVETVKTHCNASGSKSAYVYYYCYFGHNTDEASPFLKWTISQLCRKADIVPTSLYKLYKCGEELSLANLLSVLEAILQEFDCVYVILDAIDESIPRTGLLHVLQNLISDLRFSKIRTLATSREYIDIEEMMEGISVPISMRNPLLDEDIRLFVQSQLGTHPKLKRWPASVRDRALEALSTKAKGMFRWVVCQIDVLQHLKPDGDIIEKALAGLPRTLDETYEQIFLRVPDEARLVVHHALKWIYAHNALHRGNIPLSNLVQALQKCADRGDSSEFEYDYNEALLREFCGCLIWVSPQACRPSTGEHLQPRAVVSIAHYTVLEFLESARIRNGPASLFAIDKEIAKLEFAKIVMDEALNSKENELWEPDPDNLGERIEDAIEQDFNLFSIVSSILAVHAWGPMLSRDITLSDLALAMFDPLNQHFQHFKKAAIYIGNYTDTFLDHSLPNSEQFWDPEWTQRASNDNVETLLNLLLADKSGRLGRSFLQKVPPEVWLRDSFGLKFEAWDLHNSDDLDAYNFQGTIVEFFAQLAKIWPSHLRLFLDHAVGFFDPSRILVTSVAWNHHDGKRYCKNHCLVARLIQLGADPNGHGYGVCPLQIAAGAWDLEGVKVLLEAGADPNNTGDRSGIVWEDGTIPALFNGYQDRSPLNIVQTVVGEDDDRVEQQREEKRSKIIAVLRQYGGRDFTMSETQYRHQQRMLRYRKTYH